MKLAFLAKGNTLSKYPGREGYDEVWGLNQTAQTHDLDRLFVMDDLELRLPFYDGNEFPEWLKSYSGRLITSRAYSEWPSSEAFPLIDVAKNLGLPLGVAMNSTVDYMFAMAIHEKASHIDLWGVDCAPKNMDFIRCSTAIWIGATLGRGITVKAPHGSAFRPWTDVGRCLEQGLYGYVERPRIEDLIEGRQIT